MNCLIHRSYFLSIMMYQIDLNNYIKYVNPEKMCRNRHSRTFVVVKDGLLVFNRIHLTI